jgi:hypothetical protein
MIARTVLILSGSANPSVFVPAYGLRTFVEASDSGSKMEVATGAQMRPDAAIAGAYSSVTSLDVFH